MIIYSGPYGYFGSNEFSRGQIHIEDIKQRSISVFNHYSTSDYTLFPIQEENAHCPLDMFRSQIVIYYRQPVLV